MKFSDEEHKELAVWAALCAEHVLHFFADLHPDDPRPSEAIEAARLWAAGGMKMIDARKAAFAAHAAARETSETPAKFAARAAGHAAATAHVPTHAPHAADYAVKCAEAADVLNERDWQLSQLSASLRGNLDPPT